MAFPDRPERKILDQIDFDIQKGESVLLLGPSGSGKSTLGYALSGVIPRSIEATVTGEIDVQGRIGVLFQDPEAQFCMVTAEDEVAFGLENLRQPREKMGAKIDQVLRRFQLQDWKTRNTAEMSGGMKQKLAMACILAMEPDVYILDEPTANLDPAATTDLMQELHALWQIEQKTLLVIEHKVENVIDWINRVVLLDRDGQVLDDGAPNEVFYRRQAEIREYGIWQPTLWKWTNQLEVARPSGIYPATINELLDTLPDAKLPEFKTLVDKETGNHTQAGTTEPMENIFQVQDAVFGYDADSTVWGPISFSVESGEWVAIVGPNGSGKSTLLASLMGLRTLQEGHIFLHGKDLKTYSGQELSQQLGFVFQNPEHQFVTDTVWQEAAFGAVDGKNADSNESIKQRVRAILDDLGLLYAANASPFSLSQGEKRRLSVATTLLTPHEALLLDEPTFGQDAQTASELEEKWAELHDEGRTIIMVTHDMELVARRASKVLVLAEGKLIFAGPPGDLFANPSLLQTACLQRPIAYEAQAALFRRGM